MALTRCFAPVAATSGAAGYSGTPLAKKLGIGAGCRVYAENPLAGYAALLAPLPPAVSFEAAPGPGTDLVHLFTDRSARLRSSLTALRGVLRPDAAVWVSWPKKASKVPTDITEDTIRAIALPLGYVDIKVCAVDAVWSGLKLVVRKELR
jgi:hypothetical protein